MSSESDTELADRLAASERRVAALAAKHLPHSAAASGHPQFAPKHCPDCGEQMEAGIIGVHGELWAFLLIGLSYQHCWFQHGDSETQVIRSGRGRRGHRCPKCGYVGISGGKDLPLRGPAAKV